MLEIKYPEIGKYEGIDNVFYNVENYFEQYYNELNQLNSEMGIEEKLDVEVELEELYIEKADEIIFSFTLYSSDGLKDYHTVRIDKDEDDFEKIKDEMYTIYCLYQQENNFNKILDVKELF